MNLRLWLLRSSISLVIDCQLRLISAEREPSFSTLKSASCFKRVATFTQEISSPPVCRRVSGGIMTQIEMFDIWLDIYCRWNCKVHFNCSLTHFIITEVESCGWLRPFAAIHWDSFWLVKRSFYSKHMYSSTYISVCLSCSSWASMGLMNKGSRVYSTTLTM